MNILDIVLIVVALAFIALGAAKGFIKTVMGLVAWIGSIIIAAVLCKTVAGALETTKLGTSINEWALGLLNSKITNFSISGTEEEMLAQIKELLTSMKMPKLAVNSMAEKIVEILPENGFKSISAIFAATVTNWILLAIAFLGLLVVSRIILGIVKMVLSKAANLPVIKVIDRVGGAAVYLVLCYVLLSLIASIYSLLKPLPFMEKPNKYVEDSKISTVIVENNAFDKLFEKKVTSSEPVE